MKTLQSLWRELTQLAGFIRQQMEHFYTINDQRGNKLADEMWAHAC